MCYGSIGRQILSSLHHFHVQIAKFSIRKMSSFRPESQKNEIIVTLRFSDMLYMYMYMYMLKSHVIFRYCVCVCLTESSERSQSTCQASVNDSSGIKWKWLTKNTKLQLTAGTTGRPWTSTGGWVREWERVVVGYLCSSSDDLAGWSIDHNPPPPHTHIHAHSHSPIHTHMLSHTQANWEVRILGDGRKFYIDHSKLIY